MVVAVSAVSGRRRTCVQRVAEVPRLPGVAHREVEAWRVRAQPAVGRLRPEVELRAEPVQRLAGARDPLRVRAAGPQDRLIGVGAIAAHDDQVDAVRASCGGEAVERRRDVRAHRDALPARERAAVARARGRRGQAVTRRG